MGQEKILVVDDEKNILTTLSRTLGLEGYAVEVAGGGKIALEKFQKAQPDVVLLDVKMPDIDGLAVLEKLRVADPSVPVVMMSGHGTIDTAVRATKLGAYDFIEKPLSMDRVLLAVGNATQMRRLNQENRRLRSDVESRYQIVGEDQSDIAAGLLSFSAPIARALIGRIEGDVVDVKTPGGTKSYEILRVLYI